MPWALAKDEAKKERLATVLYNLVESISVGATLLESFMPETSDKVLHSSEHRNASFPRWIPLVCIRQAIK